MSPPVPRRFDCETVIRTTSVFISMQTNCTAFHSCGESNLHSHSNPRLCVFLFLYLENKIANNYQRIGCARNKMQFPLYLIAKGQSGQVINKNTQCIAVTFEFCCGCCCCCPGDLPHNVQRNFYLGPRPMCSRFVCTRHSIQLQRL